MPFVTFRFATGGLSKPRDHGTGNGTDCRKEGIPVDPEFVKRYNLNYTKNSNCDLAS